MRSIYTILTCAFLLQTSVAQATGTLRVLPRDHQNSRIVRAILTPMRDSVITTGYLEGTAIFAAPVFFQNRETLMAAGETFFRSRFAASTEGSLPSSLKLKFKVVKATPAALARALRFYGAVNDFDPEGGDDWLAPEVRRVRALMARLGMQPATSSVITMHTSYLVSDDEGFEEGGRQVQQVLVLDSATGLGFSLLMFEGRM